jgi:hypothetical protein
MPRFIVASTVLAALCLFAFGQSEQNTSGPFEAIYTPSGIQWSLFAPFTELALTVAGPDGFCWRQEYGADSRPEFGLFDEQGVPHPDGLYRWELVVRLPAGSGDSAAKEPNPIFSGSFLISGGVIVPQPNDSEAAMVEDGAPVHSLFLDRKGRLGLGTTVPASQLHLKGTNPAFTLEDTTSGGRAFTLRGQEKGDGSLGLFDQTTGEARWLVDNEGRMGINTTKPTSTLTVDGYIESTKGFLVNGRPVGRFGLFGGNQPLWVEGASNSFFGTNAGNATMTGILNSFFGVNSGSATTSGAGNTFAGWGAGASNASGNDNSFFGAGAGNRNTASDNAFFGQNAGNQNTSGTKNAFFGKSAGQSNTSGGYNSFFGNQAGSANASSTDNSFFGASAGKATTGSSNSFFGSAAGMDNTTGSNNSFFGIGAGALQTTAHENSFFGAQTGGFSGSQNCFFGAWTGNVNLGGSLNAFFGYYAGQSNHTGNDNSFVGAYAGAENDTGYDNVFIGRDAGYSNTTGYQNSFVGRSAGYASTVETGNTFLGYLANFYPGSNPSINPVTNATAIGNRSYVAQSNSLILGSIPGVNGGASYVNVGIGTTTPARQLHLAGPNAVFRMDRPSDTAAFLLVRTDASGTTPWKTFVVGTNATGVNQGEFIINDVGTAVGGVGNRRMTITNDGAVQFTGTVYAAGFVPTSSAAFKTNIRTFENALDTVNRLRGVRFDWKDSGQPAVGLIAEEVNEVLPEVVAQEGGEARGVNYANLVAVLVEAVKEQQKTIEEQRAEIDKLKDLQAKVERLEALMRER